LIPGVVMVSPGQAGVPYVAPIYGGVDARVLFIARDPGPKTQGALGGSGFLSLENDDASAERFATLLDEAGIPVGETLPWNAYPWYINRKPTAAQLEAGVEPLARLLSLLPKLGVVVLLGGSAQDGWSRLARRHRGLVAGFEVVPTYHTSNQALIGSPKERAERMAKLKEAFARTAQLLQDPEITKIADLLRRRNEIDADIARITGRPMTSGHLGEWIAAQVFDIALEEAANAAAFDGRFHGGPLTGKTVNVKWYLKHEGLLDMTESAILDFYLVLTGPHSAAVSSRSSTRPWCVDAVYLFDAADLLARQRARNVKIGVATSVLKAQWEAAEIFPAARNLQLPLTPAQKRLLRLLADPGPTDPGG
jgi:uracil-DNA glycosylase